MSLRNAQEWDSCGSPKAWWVYTCMESHPRINTCAEELCLRALWYIYTNTRIKIQLNTKNGNTRRYKVGPNERNCNSLRIFFFLFSCITFGTFIIFIFFNMNVKIVKKYYLQITLPYFVPETQFLCNFKGNKSQNKMLSFCLQWNFYNISKRKPNSPWSPSLPQK